MKMEKNTEPIIAKTT